MSVRYNDRTGMFEDVPSLSGRMGGIGRFLGRLMRFAFKVCCWTAGLGLVAGAVYIFRDKIATVCRGDAVLETGGKVGDWISEAATVAGDMFRHVDGGVFRGCGTTICAIGPYLLVGVLVFAIWECRRLIWSLFKVPLGIVFYPIVKWWGFVKESWNDGDRFMACLMVFPGLILIGLYRLIFTVVLSAFGDSFSVAGSWDALKVAIVIGGFVLFVIFYGRALAEAQHGSLVVYRDWGDFAKSAVWVIAVPVGVAWTFEAQGDFLFRCAGLALLVVGAVSFCTMVSGAFKSNSGSERWLALFARMGVILMLMFALGRLQEKLDRYKRGELGVIRGVLIPLAVFAWMFNYLIRPMIRTELRRW